MDNISVLNPVHKTTPRISEFDESNISKKESSTFGRSTLSHNRNITSNAQKSKKVHEQNVESIPEKKEIVRFPSLIDINNFKLPQYIVYSDSRINGDLILNDLNGELWLQPSSSVLSKKSENRLRSKLEISSTQLNSKKDKDDIKIGKSGNKRSKNLSSSTSISLSALSDNKNGFENNFKRNFDKYYTDVQKLIDYAKNPIFNEGSTQNISIDLEKDKRKKKSQNSNYDPHSADSQKITINGRKPIRVINMELEMKLDNLRNNDIERENFERKIENLLQTKKIQKLNFNILLNNRKIKKIEEIKKLKNEYIERYNKHIIEVLKQEKKILINRLNKIKKEIDYKDLCTELEKERERKMVERVNVNKYDLVLRRWLTLCIIGSRMMLMQDALVANLKDFVF